MTNEQKINRLRNIERCTPIHTREDIQDFEALEGAIEAIETLGELESIIENVFKEIEGEIIAGNRMMAVSGMSIEELTDAFTKGYRLASPEAVKNLQEPCEDAISRQAVLDKKELVELEDGQSFYCISPEDVKTLPSVNPQPKTGHWIKGKYSDDNIRYNDNSYKCDKCGRIVDFKENFCPDCGERKVEPREWLTELKQLRE